MSDEQARRVYDAARIGQRITLGERPAVLVVDFSCGFTDPACALGSDLSEAVGATAELLRLARELGVPVIFTTIAFGSSLADGGLWLQKMPALADLQIGGQWVEIDPRLRAPRRRDRRGQEGGVGLLRHEPHCDPRLPGDRHRRAVRCDHERVRASHRDRPDAERVPRRRAPRKRGRPGAGAARGQPLRHPGKVRRRHRRSRTAVGYLVERYRRIASRGRNIQ